jgi:hypothetical protein
MSETVAHWRDFLPRYFVLPHPSWHTIRWRRDNLWFEREVLPDLRSRVGRVLDPEALDRSNLSRESFSSLRRWS